MEDGKDVVAAQIPRHSTESSQEAQPRDSPRTSPNRSFSMRFANVRRASAAGSRKDPVEDAARIENAKPNQQENTNPRAQDSGIACFERTGSINSSAHKSSSGPLSTIGSNANSREATDNQAERQILTTPIDGSPHIDFHHPFWENEVKEHELQNLQGTVKELTQLNKELIDTHMAQGIQTQTLEREYAELECRANETFLENRRLRAYPPRGMEELVVIGLRDLWTHVMQWCNQASRHAQTCTLLDAQLEQLREVLSLDQMLDAALLASSISQIGRAYLTTMLVDKVFYKSPRDIRQTKDLWTSAKEAFCLASIEERIAKSDLSTEELNKWRCLTVRTLAQRPKQNKERIDGLVEELFTFTCGLFGLEEGSSTATNMRNYLELRIVAKAVSLSREIRMQRSAIWVRIPTDEDDTNTFTNVHDPHGLLGQEGQLPAAAEKASVVKLVVRPALIRSTDEDGAVALQGETVLVQCEKWIIVHPRDAAR